MIRNYTVMLCLLVGLALPAMADAPVIRAAVLKIGTVNWELDTITRNGLDRANGFRLSVQPYADNGATRVALEGGTADLAIADWIWVARQRAAGKDYVFIPYSKAVGGIVVPQDSPAQTLADLKGRKIGIAGGPLDKSWLILRAYAKAQYNMDLERETEQVFGAPPLIYKTALSGEVDGAITYWHYLAQMKAAGMRPLISVQKALITLGLDPEVPLLGYVMKESFLAQHPGLAADFYTATRGAKTLLAEDAAWETLRPQMNTTSQAHFETLRTDFREGIPKPGAIDPNSADQVLQLMAHLGGQKLVGAATTLPAGLFVALE